MPRKFKFCLHCRRTIVEKEIQRGLFVQTPQGMLCATCAQKLDEETEAAKHLAAAQAPAPAKPPAPQIEEKAAPDPPASAPPVAPQSGAPQAPAQLLDGIRQQVEAIHRTLLFEKSSPWAVLATVAQCLAVGMLILAAVNWADNPMHLLLVALIFQVMALTFFVRGK